ncbi:GtrA family protein [Rhodoferax sp. GW822-FHT02A01]|jgi:putative flippase GtrA|uniref:GtrA family protein n=1 Tax=Rhodoferax sp. GW822-FHT02A01 TaxID=3141537 RepID=UPI00315D5A5F
MRDFARFVVVGGVGFGVDAGVMMGLLRLGAPLLAARLASFGLAVTVTWTLNRAWTFSHPQPRRARRAYIEYLAGQTMGAGINFSVFFLALACWTDLKQYPLVPLALASGVAMVFNFLVARHLVFKPGRG